MKTRRFVAALVLGVFSAGMVGGCVSATVALSPDAAAFDGKRIAVFDVSETKRRLIWTIGIAGEVRFRQSEEMLQSLEQAFIEHGLFQILDRSQVMALVEDKNLSVPPRPSTQDAVKLARMAGLDGVVILDFHGEFSWATLFVDENYRATAKLIDVNTGRQIWSARARYYYFTVIPFPMSRTFTKGAFASMADEIAEELREQIGKQAQPPPGG